MESPAELDSLLIKSLVLLELRLKRLEFYLEDDRPQELKDKDGDAKPEPVIKRLEKLEKKWQKLAETEKIVGDAVDFHQSHRELFTPADNDAEEPIPPPDIQVSSVLVDANKITGTASDLHALELPFPDTSSFTSLAALAPRMAAQEDRQIRQALEISELRKRTMMAVSRFKKVHLEGNKEVWKEWDATMSSWEREVAREEVKRNTEAV